MLHEIELNLLNSRSILSRKDNFPAKTSDTNRREKTLLRKISADALSVRLDNSLFKNTGFHNLESKILLTIFKNLSEEELSLSVCRVSRHWYRVARDPNLWKKLKLKGEKIDTITMCNLLRKCRNLEYLYLNNSKDTATLIRQMCRSNRSIKRLKIKNCRYGESETIPDIVLRNILHSCRDLESLNLKETQFYSTRFYNELANLPMLRELNLNKNNYIEAKNLISIALNCRNLESISLAGGKNILKIVDDDVVYLFKSLSKSLKRVEIDTTGLGAKSFQAILNCPNLEYLSLRNALLLTGEIFSSQVSKLRYLKRLSLTKACQLVSKDLVLPNENNAFDNLDLIDLTCCCRICDVGLRTLLLSCKDKLTHLSLKSCKSIRDLSIVIDNCPKLKYLNIAHVFDSNISCIDNLPLKIAKLEKLVVDKKTVSNNDLVKLRNQAPRLTMVRSMSQFHKDEATIFSNEDRRRKF